MAPLEKRAAYETGYDQRRCHRPVLPIQQKGVGGGKEGRRSRGTA